MKNIGNLLQLDEYNINEVLQGTSFAIYNAKSDKEKYEKYKKGELEDMKEYEERNMKIYSLLEDLGYPMDELGTYLYQEVIAEIYEQIKDINKRSEMQKARELLASLSDAYSNFYRWIARDYLEMGITSFHLYIEKAISKIDEDKIKPETAIRVFGRNPEEMNYGLQAFQLAGYLANKYSMKYEKPKILGLSDISRDAKLKGDNE